MSSATLRPLPFGSVKWVPLSVSAQIRHSIYETDSIDGRVNYRAKVDRCCAMRAILKTFLAAASAKAVAQVCLLHAQCGHSDFPTARFCSSCGFPLVSDNAERKHATVMFVDIVGSTEIISGLDPEQSLARLKPALEIMCTTVMRFDGTVARAMGDGIMALFGAPRAQEGHAFLACEAALAIQTEFSRNGRETMVRIGLHSGDLLSGILDSDPTREASAHGLTVHIASRLQAIAEPGGICYLRRLLSHCGAIL